METFPQTYARVGGVLYLLIIVLGVLANAFVRGTLVVDNDAAATAHNIMASQSLWSVGAAANLLVVLCAVPLLLIEYVLLRPVNRNLALLAVFFNLVSLAVEAVSKLFFISVLTALRSADHLLGWSPTQIEGMSYLALTSYDIAFNIALVFFGFTCIVNGYLIFKSLYLPKLIGVLMQIAGVCY